MKKNEFIELVRMGKLSSFYGNVARTTHYFDYKGLDDIISALDNKRAIDLFCQAVCDEFDLYLNSPIYIHKIEQHDKRGKVTGLLYGGSIAPVLKELSTKAILRLHMDISNTLQADTESHVDLPKNYTMGINIRSVGTLQIGEKDIINQLLKHDQNNHRIGRPSRND